MISSIAEILFQYRLVASYETRAHARHVRPFRQAVKYDTTLEGLVAELVRRFQQPDRRIVLIQIELAVTLVGCDDEAEASR